MDLDSFLDTEISGKTIKQNVDEMIAKIGENIVISDLRIFDNPSLNYLSNKKKGISLSKGIIIELNKLAQKYKVKTPFKI